MADDPVVRDERTVAVENASYRLACFILTFGVLLIAGVRGIVLKEACWDLFALVVFSGGAATYYQAKRQTLAPRWWRLAIFLVLVGAVAGLAAAVLAMMLKR
jgi:hypothetical protein